jgi:hypothetical protein
VTVAHFTAVAGENAWSDVALLIVIGRTEPAPSAVERIARVLFGAEVAELCDWYPQLRRGVRMRDGRVFAAESSKHPDPQVEAVRWSICEAQLLQAIGRGRAVNRTADNPLLIDVVTNVALPIVVDEFITWDLIQPTIAETMRSRGAVPTTYRDTAGAYPDLVPTPHAAEMALRRENPQQSPIVNYLIGVCGGFRSIRYRHTGSRGPASLLLYDPERIDPVIWLADHIGEVTIVGAKQPKRKKRAEKTPTRKPVKVKGAKPLHYRKRTREDIAIGGEAWVSYDGEVALPARVLDKDDRHYFVEFECGHRRYPGVCNGTHSLYHDEVRTTPELACVNMVTL